MQKQQFTIHDKARSKLCCLWQPSDFHINFNVFYPSHVWGCKICRIYVYLQVYRVVCALIVRNIVKVVWPEQRAVLKWKQQSPFLYATESIVIFYTLKARSHNYTKTELKYQVLRPWDWIDSDISFIKRTLMIMGAFHTIESFSDHKLRSYGKVPRIKISPHYDPKQHSIWVPVGPQSGHCSWAPVGLIWECCLGCRPTSYDQICQIMTIGVKPFSWLGHIFFTYAATNWAWCEMHLKSISKGQVLCKLTLCEIQHEQCPFVENQSTIS